METIALKPDDAAVVLAMNNAAVPNVNQADLASLAGLGDEDAAGFGEGIAKVISYYESLGNHPFTLAYFSSPQPGGEADFSLQVRICSRPAFRPLYSNYDTWFTPKFLGDDVHTQAPEQYAGALRQRW